MADDGAFWTGGVSPRNLADMGPGGPSDYSRPIGRPPYQGMVWSPQGRRWVWPKDMEGEQEHLLPAMKPTANMTPWSEQTDPLKRAFIALKKAR